MKKSGWKEEVEEKAVGKDQIGGKSRRQRQVIGRSTKRRMNRRKKGR